MTQTWEVISGAGDIVWKVSSSEHPQWTWWPDLSPDLCQLIAGLDSWDIPTVDSTSLPKCDHGTDSGCPLCVSTKCFCDARIQTRDAPGCSTPRRRAALRELPFYVCPRDGRNRAQAYRCGGIESFYCYAWGCETTGNTYWAPTSSWDLIAVKRVVSQQGGLSVSSCGVGYWTGEGPCTDFTCNPLNITFTGKGKENRDWVKGRQWGLRFYKGGYDDGLVFRIRLQFGSRSSKPVGPNKILVDQGRPEVQGSQPIPTTLTPSLTPRSMDKRANTGQRLLNLIEGGFDALNRSQPNLTDSCWICLSSGPPYYEGVAANGTYHENKSSALCDWGRSHMLTLPEVTGQGVCIGTPRGTDKSRCLRIDAVAPNHSYLIPVEGTRWACYTGLTPCISTQVFNNTGDFCILVRIFPRLLYHGEADFEEAIAKRNRYKREPVSLTLAVLLGAGLVPGIGTGTAALVEGPKQMKMLESAITQDLQAIEQSIEALEKSLTSLSEVALQNRRGLDLLFLKEGGLCAALREECCFYADHTGVVRDSMAKLKERLNAREKMLQGQQGWFERWYTKSPWLTTLISALTGPLIVFLLVITIGPCVLNRLSTFLQKQIRSVKMMVIRQQYVPVDRESDF